MQALKISEREKGQLLRDLRAFRENHEWIVHHRERLRETYRGRYIAVKDKKVIGESEDLKELLARLKKYKVTNDIAIDYMAEKKVKYLL